MNRTSVGALVAIPILVGATLLGSGSAGATPLSAGAAPNAAAIGASAPAASGAAYSDGTYIVQMRDLPVASYDGSLAGYTATKAKAGKKFDSTTAAATKYASYLTGSHDSALNKVGGAAKLYDYLFSFNGFAAKLTGAQAGALAKAPGVVAVTPQELRKGDTTSTPSFLGLNDAATGGLWTPAGGNLKGEGVIIGIIDSGIWPESLSFTDRVDANGNPAAQGF
ncbi:MAG TPA: S8 family serine peptidase, partial [Dermatophilaceae bacterium]|nr:S8 family serine peptidase [Dermatophilaceae bacterium]